MELVGRNSFQKNMAADDAGDVLDQAMRVTMGNHQIIRIAPLNLNPKSNTPRPNIAQKKGTKTAKYGAKYRLSADAQLALPLLEFGNVQFCVAQARQIQKTCIQAWETPRF